MCRTVSTGVRDQRHSRTMELAISALTGLLLFGVGWWLTRVEDWKSYAPTGGATGRESTSASQARPRRRVHNYHALVEDTVVDHPIVTIPQQAADLAESTIDALVHGNERMPVRAGRDRYRDYSGGARLSQGAISRRPESASSSGLPGTPAAHLGTEVVH